MEILPWFCKDSEKVHIIRKSKKVRYLIVNEKESILFLDCKQRYSNIDILEILKKVVIYVWK